MVKEEKEPIDIEITEQNADPENNKNAFDFRWLGVQDEDEEDITLANFIENYKNKLMKKALQKSN